MTPTRPQQGASETLTLHRKSWAWHAARLMALAGLVITPAGCAGPLAHARLPARAIPAAGLIPPARIVAPAPKATSALMTPRWQVLAALARYTTALGKAEDAKSSAAARELLRPYLAAGRVDGLVLAMTTIWARGESFSGQDIRHVSSVAVVGRHAFVHDCDNTSGMALVEAASGQIVPDSSGTPRVNVVTRLDLVSGHWLVQFQLVEDVPCVP